MVTPLSTIIFALYNHVTQLDLTSPHEMFWRLPGAQCVAASAVGGEVHADDGLIISNVQGLAGIPHVDLTYVPGGFGVIGVMEDAEFMRQVWRLAGDTCYVTSVCDGSLMLGTAGLLQGKRAARHWARRSPLPAFGAATDEAHVVRGGNLITDGGVIAGIDMMLTVTTSVAGAEHTRAVQFGAEYTPTSPFDCGCPEHAAPETLVAVTSRLDHLRADHHDAVWRTAWRL